ncbi:uncharacterized protein LOC107197760 [Astyanax mexicanus]|uniref:uncharacterized protein LOC107197760 n=1 Tax=Astyanax mexicanus TaxID=7994 RepID=UPI0020CABDF3|nr:uncharacterized protein LOC107197760 [Astyanax mexicanus]
MVMVMFSCDFRMYVWPLLLWLVNAVLTDSNPSIVTQWPDVVVVTTGQTVTLNCSVVELYSPCCSVTWLRTYSDNMTLSKTDPSKVTIKSSSYGWTEVCSAVISSQTVQDSGMYYCVVVQGKFAHIGNGSRVIVKDPLVSPEVEVTSSVSSSASIVSLQCLVTGVLPAQVRMYWLLDERQVMGHTHSTLTYTYSNAPEFTINQLIISAEEWQRHRLCVCVVEYGRDTFNKTLQPHDTCSVCGVLKHLYMTLSLVSCLLILIIIAAKLALKFKNQQRN